MDIGAYSNIEKYEKIASDNNIYVPKLVGYRLMSEENKMEMPKIEEIISEIYDDLIHSSYLGILYEDDNYFPKYLPNWKKIHGRKRKALKFKIKKQLRSISKQINAFNKYAGREDVLMISARIGGDDWIYYKDSIINQPWLLEIVEDAYDETYYDIYAKIKNK